METIILILVVIGIVSLILTAISDIIINISIKKKYNALIKLQETIIEDNKDIADKFETFKKVFNKNITDIAKTFDFYDRRIMFLEQKQYKRNKNINSNIIPSNIDDVQ